MELAKPVWTSLGQSGDATDLNPEVGISLAVGPSQFDAKDRDKERLQAILTLTFVAPGNLEVACVSQSVHRLLPESWGRQGLQRHCHVMVRDPEA